MEYFSLISKCRWTSIGHPDRLKWPLIRRNGQLQRATWDEAMSLVTEKAQEVQSRLTNHGIGFYTSGQLFLEEYYVLAMVGKAGLNTLHMYGIHMDHAWNASATHWSLGMAILASAPQPPRPACASHLGVMNSLDRIQTSIIPIVCSS